MGGNPTGDRTQPQKLISLCLVKHGAWDRGEIHIWPQDQAKGFDWCADFFTRVESGVFKLYASERLLGVSAMRGQ